MSKMEIPEAYATAEKIAKEAGFKLLAFADAATIELKQEVRDMCATNTCGKYGSNWAYPPGCGELDECRAKVAPYKWGIIVQTSGQLEDSFDFETVAELSAEHDENFLKILEPMREAFPGMLQHLQEMLLSRQALPFPRKAGLQCGGLRHGRQRVRGEKRP